MSLFTNNWRKEVPNIIFVAEIVTDITHTAKFRDALHD